MGERPLGREVDSRAIETMKAQSGKDLIIFGSGSIVSQLTRDGLIDEYRFAVCPARSVVSVTAPLATQPPAA